MPWMPWLISIDLSVINSMILIQNRSNDSDFPNYVMVYIASSQPLPVFASTVTSWGTAWACHPGFHFIEATQRFSSCFITCLFLRPVFEVFLKHMLPLRKEGGRQNKSLPCLPTLFTPLDGSGPHSNVVGRGLVLTPHKHISPQAFSCESWKCLIS